MGSKAVGTAAVGTAAVGEEAVDEDAVDEEAVDEEALRDRLLLLHLPPLTFRHSTFRGATYRPVKIYRKSGRGAAAIPIPGPRPRPRHVPPPCATMVRPRAAGRSSVRSEPVEGPLLAGITVTVFPGRSSRPLSGVDAVLAGWAVGSGAARTGAGAAVASITLGSRLERGAGARRAANCERRRLRCWIRRCCISTGEAIST
jgi:hypothetical protein